MFRRVRSIMLALLVLAACSKPSSHGPAAPGASSVSGGAPPATAGQRIFNNTCVACHQEGGEGIAGVYPSLVKSPVVLGDPKDLARWVVLGQRPASMPAGRYTTQMPQYGWLKPADAASVLTYVRSSFGNSAPPVDAVAVAAAIGP